MAQLDICGFCKRGSEADNICGRLHSELVNEKRVTAHHKCMQYSAQLVQYKFEHFGGFKIHRVQDELKRGIRVHCSICRGHKGTYTSSGATAGCAIARCRKSFHFYCAKVNPHTITKRLKVKDKTKEVVLYRVFCSKEHEDLYRTQLKGKKESHLDDSDESDSSSEEDEDSDDESDDTSTHGTNDRRIITHRKSSGKNNSEDDEDHTWSANGLVLSDITEDFNTSPDAVSDSGSNCSAILSERIPYSEFALQHKSSDDSMEIPRQDNILPSMKTNLKITSNAQSGEETFDQIETDLQDPTLKENGRSEERKVMDKISRVYEPDIRQENHNTDNANRDKFLVVIVPVVQCSSELRQKIYEWAHSEFNLASQEYVIIWQDMFCPVGLTEQFLSHIMYDVCDKVIRNDTDGISQVLFNCELDKYSHTVLLTDMIKGQDMNVIDLTIFSFINEVIKDTNSKAKSKLASLLSLPSSSALGLLMDDYIDPTYQVRSKLHKPLYHWTSNTRIVIRTGNIRHRPNREFERSTIMLELRKLLCGRFELQTRPIEDVFCTIMADSFMDRMKQNLQELFAVPVTESNTSQPTKKQIVLCITGVNRDIVKYKAYVHKVTEDFFTKYMGKGMELFCIFSIGESSEFASYQDVVPVKFHVDKNLTIFSAFCPEFVPVECVVFRYNDLKDDEKEPVLKRPRDAIEPSIKRNLDVLFSNKPDVEMQGQLTQQNLQKEQEIDGRIKPLHHSLRSGKSQEHPNHITSAESSSQKTRYAEDIEKPSTSGWISPRKKKRLFENAS